ncbi:MAG: tyrosine-type recombinase/integrase, partial [Hyphomicrobium sp.]|nr:tyrosine-type recombinase/integrase [Hyphomicrobium sp.]
AITLPASAVEMLRDHRRTQQMRDRLERGLGAAPKYALVFPCPVTGDAISPNKVTREWRTLIADMGLGPVTFHALHHTHASALIAAGVDVVTVSRRLGHSSPSITLNVYAHLFTPEDKAASVIEDALGHLG